MSELPMIVQALKADFILKNRLAREQIRAEVNGDSGLLFGTSSLDIMLKDWPAHAPPDPLDTTLWPWMFGPIFQSLRKPSYTIQRRHFQDEKTNAFWHLTSYGEERVLDLHSIFTMDGKRYGLRLYSNSYDFPKEFTDGVLTWDTLMQTITSFIKAPALKEWSEQPTLTMKELPPEQKKKKVAKKPAAKKPLTKKPATKIVKASTKKASAKKGQRTKVQ